MSSSDLAMNVRATPLIVLTGWLENCAVGVVSDERFLAPFRPARNPLV
jgi:hypothetical protein